MASMEGMAATTEMDAAPELVVATIPPGPPSPQLPFYPTFRIMDAYVRMYAQSQ